MTARDLGGPVITSGRYDLLGQRLQDLEHGALPLARRPDALVTADELLGWLRVNKPADRSVIGALGVVNPRTGTLTSRALDLTDYPLQSELSAALGWPVVVANETNLTAWNAWRHLGLTADDPLLYVNYSLGLAVGMMLSGTLYHGATEAAGEISLLALMDPDRHHDHPMLRLAKHRVAALPGGTVTQVAARASHGDPSAHRALRAFTSDLADDIAIVAAVIDPALLVLQYAEPTKDETRE